MDVGKHRIYLVLCNGELQINDCSWGCCFILGVLSQALSFYMTSASESIDMQKVAPPCARFTHQTQCAKMDTIFQLDPQFDKSWRRGHHVRRPSVLYLSAHQGTAMDMAYICQSLGVAFKWISPRLPYEVTKELAADDWERYGRDYQCGLFDYIIVADTNAKARGLLEYQCNDSQIVLHSTQRFDTGMEGQQQVEWRLLLEDKVRKMKNLHLIANNPYEIWYAHQVRSAKFFKPRLIRPAGHWPKRDQLAHDINVGDSETNVVVLQQYLPYLNQILLGNLSIRGIQFQTLHHGKYGGAARLAQYRCVIQFPYQVSVMAMYENLANGVALLVPSLQFYRNIARALLENGVTLHLVDLDVLERRPLGWTAIEWWTPYFSDVLIHFDSWEHLTELLTDDDDFKTHKKQVVQFMNRHNATVLHQWSDFLWCRLPC